MTLRNALLAASILAAPLAAPAAALAQPVDGLYVGAAAGGSVLQDQDLGRSSFPVQSLSRTPGTGRAGRAIGGSVGTDAGPVASGSVGYGFGNGLRAEVQGDWRSNKLDHVGSYSAGGEKQQYGGFLNVLYDFDLTPFGVTGLSPYLGAGVGYERAKFNNARFYGGTNTAFYARSTGSAGNLAAQGMAGLAYNISAVPGLALTAEYRFTTIPGPTSFEGQYFERGVEHRIKLREDGTYNHAGLIGLRYAFNNAPPPPPPAPAPIATPPVAPARTYLVFFDWDRADLTTRARQIISEAAQASTRVHTTRIEVNGYTDLSGTPAYNQRLSVRRAESVQAELVRDGVPKSEIGIHGFGETNPLVPTAQGVREPQNRRVEIILH
ncbi:MAG: OmpA family protein [Janthinobacterium lividum]